MMNDDDVKQWEGEGKGFGQRPVMWANIINLAYGEACPNFDNLP